MNRKEHLLDAVSRAGVVRIRTIANNPLWLCALVIPVSFAAALIALGLNESVFAWVFVGVAIASFLFAIGFIGYFARFDPDRLQSEEYRIRQRALQILYRKGAGADIVDVANQAPRIEGSRTRTDNGEKA